MSMEQYLTAEDIAARLKCSRRKAYEIMREMPVLRSPRRVSERALRDWIDRNTDYPRRRD